MNRPTVAITIGTDNYSRMFSDAALEALSEFADVVHAGQEPAGKTELLELLAGADGCITSWGTHQLDADVVGGARNLRAMAHMGSSVKRFTSQAFWDRGIHLTSAGITLARDVAETTLGLMIVGRKRVIPLGRHLQQGGWRESSAWDRWDARELTRSTVGLIGASNVGRHVISLLAPFETTILVADPYLDAAGAAELGVTKVELSELLERADIVSLHCPSTPSTHHILDEPGLALMADHALLRRTHRRGRADCRAEPWPVLCFPRRDRSRTVCSGQSTANSRQCGVDSPHSRVHRELQPHGRVGSRGATTILRR